MTTIASGMRLEFRAVGVAILSSILLWGAAAHGEDIAGHAVVEDGDTITIGQESIRLEGIDAPETWPWEQGCITQALVVQACGEAATQALRKKIGGEIVRCEISGRDVYKRALGTCFVGAVNINGWLVREGYAVAFRRYSQAYISDEDAAKKERRGIWATKFTMPAIWRCRVNSVSQERFARCAKITQ